MSDVRVVSSQLHPPISTVQLGLRHRTRPRHAAGKVDQQISAITPASSSGICAHLWTHHPNHRPQACHFFPSRAISPKPRTVGTRNRIVTVRSSPDHSFLSSNTLLTHRPPFARPRGNGSPPSVDSVIQIFTTTRTTLQHLPSTSAWLRIDGAGSPIWRPCLKSPETLCSWRFGGSRARKFRVY